MLLSSWWMILFGVVEADESVVVQTMVAFDGLAAKSKVLHVRVKPSLVVLVGL